MPRPGWSTSSFDKLTISLYRFRFVSALDNVRQNGCGCGGHPSFLTIMERLRQKRSTRLYSVRQSSALFAQWLSTVSHEDHPFREKIERFLQRVTALRSYRFIVEIVEEAVHGDSHTHIEFWCFKSIWSVIVLFKDSFQFLQNIHVVRNPLDFLNNFQVAQQFA